MFKKFIIAACTTVLVTGAASAATLSGLFSVEVVNKTGLDRNESKATLDNASDAKAAGGASDTFTYNGALDFGTSQSNNSTTIAQWLATGSGLVTGLDATVGGLQQSKPNINNGSATTSFYLFDLMAPLKAGDFTITHDDGIALFQDGVRFAGFDNPTSARTETFTGFTGGKFSVLYVATNGDPSILNVDYNMTPVPLPAALPLLLVGLGGLGFVARRRKTPA